MGKRKDGHFSNQTMTSSFSFVALARARTAQLHRKGILTKRNIIKTIPESLQVCIIISI